MKEPLELGAQGGLVDLRMVSMKWISRSILELIWNGLMVDVESILAPFGINVGSILESIWGPFGVHFGVNFGVHV